jgi:hypothetical protein
MKILLRKAMLLFPLVLLAALACERVRPEKGADGQKPAAAEDAMKAPAPPAQPQPPAQPPDNSAGGDPKGTFYFKVDFTVMRGLAIMQANASKFRELATKQGFLGRLITCNADPFTTLDRLTAVLPPKVRKNPGGAVTIDGAFDAAKVIACLEAELAKEDFRPETEGQTRWLKSPRMSLQLTSPGEKRVRGVSRGWDQLDFTDELVALEKRLPAGYGLLLGAVGDIFPMRTGMKLMLLSFAPSGDSLELNGLLMFNGEAMATAVHSALTTGLNQRRKAAEASTDPNMKLGASMLGRLNLTRNGAELAVSAKVPYAELVQALGLFQIKVKGTF